MAGAAPIVVIRLTRHADVMVKTLNGLTIAAIAAWSAYLLWLLAMVLRLSAWLSTSETIAGLAIPIAMIAAVLWIRFSLAARLPGRVIALFQLFILAVACLFLVSVLTPKI
ncbi:hypothetical protein [Hephaestia caeni]|uniref:hypothetical protein n=1 Tax=Hephaestia caeni TaxID=645617 RepID=UPI001B87B801|nr:hypothetical protein [Hephaestia caeni]